MKFTTPVIIPPALAPITYNDKLLAFGSCFTENIGERLSRYGFDIAVNPFGILYNPLSIANALERLLSGSLFSKEELFPHNGLWHSFSHHGSFSATTADETLQTINKRLIAAAQRLTECNHLLITFGTAWVYRLQTSGEVVANCHKLPEKQFTRSRLSVEEITGCYLPLIERLKKINPHINLLLTVSPIRHWRDGAHENQLSKATLLIAIEQIQQQYDTGYFPAYEVMMDELRDYRFYAADMLHPSETAIDYLWERFSATYFDPATRDTLHEVEQINKALAHRPLNPDTEEFRRFHEQTQKRVEKLQERYPHIRFNGQ